jgi:hypothetical protein
MGTISDNNLKRLNGLLTEYQASIVAVATDANVFPDTPLPTPNLEGFTDFLAQNLDG